MVLVIHRPACAPSNKLQTIYRAASQVRDDKESEGEGTRGDERARGDLVAIQTERTARLIVASREPVFLIQFAMRLRVMLNRTFPILSLSYTSYPPYFLQGNAI